MTAIAAVFTVIMFSFALFIVIVLSVLKFSIRFSWLRSGRDVRSDYTASAGMKIVAIIAIAGVLVNQTITVTINAVSGVAVRGVADNRTAAADVDAQTGVVIGGVALYSTTAAADVDAHIAVSAGGTVLDHTAGSGQVNAIDGCIRYCSICHCQQPKQTKRQFAKHVYLFHFHSPY